MVSAAAQGPGAASAGPGADPATQSTLVEALPAGMRWLDIAASDADSVELKVLLDPVPDVVGRVCGSGARRRRRRLYLLDTADLALSRAGVDLRLRRRTRGRHELSVRSRRRDRLRDRLRPPGARVELDLLPGALLRTTELRRPVAADLVRRCLAGAVAPIRLLSEAQHEWLVRWLGPALALGPVGLDGPDGLLEAVAVHGPVTVLRVRVPAGRFPAARAFLEHAVYPSGREVTEFSVRCHPGDAAAVACAADRYLTERGVTLARRHHTKSSCWAAEILPASESA